MGPVLGDHLYFEYAESPSSVDRAIVQKSRRHECLEPTNASRLREEHKHSVLLSALLQDSSSEEYVVFFNHIHYEYHRITHEFENILIKRTPLEHHARTQVRI